MSLSEFIKKKLATATADELSAELFERENKKNIFPLDVFHPAIKPYIEDIHNELDIPRAFIGLSMLSAYSSAIGTSYAVYTGHKPVYLSVWGCLLGMTSSGKSYGLDTIYEPLHKVQKNLDAEWGETIKGKSNEEISKLNMPTLLYREANISTVVRSFLPSNKKGITKYCDELLEWINGLNQLSKKEGTDEQFWLSTWNCSPYTVIRAGNQKSSLYRPFANVIGCTQPAILHKFYACDRDKTGFVFRMLFGIAEENRIAQPNMFYTMSDDMKSSHSKPLLRMNDELKMHDDDQEPRRIVLDDAAKKLYMQWAKDKVTFINQQEDDDDRELHAGILGKIKEYILRFAGLFVVSDAAYNPNMNAYFPAKATITKSIMERAIKLADYFYDASLTAYNMVLMRNSVPLPILQMALALKHKVSKKNMALYFYKKDDAASCKRMSRAIVDAIQKYPRAFNAQL